MGDLLQDYRIHLTIALLAAFLLLWGLEHLFPLRARKRPLWHRLAVNAAFSVLVFLIGATIIRYIGAGLAEWTQRTAFGLLPALSLPAPAAFVVGFLLMDLTFFYWHRLNHCVPFLWRFHNVHHVDPDLDVTTSFRFHAVEILYSAGFRVVQVGLIGVAPLTYAAYEAVFTLGTMFHHSNVRLPIRLERGLNFIVVTPRMHGIHHSVVKEETNSNYGVVFRWWDRLHRTMGLDIPQSKITIGVPAYLEPEDNSSLNLAVLPFRGQREYWRFPDDGAPQRSPADRAGHPGALSP